MNSLKPINKSAETEVEQNSREFVRRGGTALRQAESDSEVTSNKLSTLLRRVSLTSTREFADLISELRTLRDRLQTDGARVQATLRNTRHRANR